MFARPPHGPGFRPGGPPLGHFGFGGSPTVAPGPGAGMDFSVFMDNGHGHMTGLERPKKVRCSLSFCHSQVKTRICGMVFYIISYSSFVPGQTLDILKLFV